MKRWLMETFMKLYYYFVKLTTLSDNYVYDRWMTYNSSPLMTEPSYKFWQDLSADWSTDENEIYYYDLNGENIDTINEIARNIPDNVSNVVLHTKYYKSRMTYYKAERADGEYAWPPVKKTRSGMSFNPIVLDAWCGTQEEPKKFNIFCVIRELAGPRGDFHGSDVPLKHVVDIDQPLITIQYANGTEKVLTEDDSFSKLF